MALYVTTSLRDVKRDFRCVFPTLASIYLSDDQLTRTYTIQNGDTTLTPARLSYTEGVGLSLHLAPLLRRRRRC